MSIEISVRDFDQWVREAYSKLFADDRDKISELLDWRFASNPHGPAKFVAADVDGEPVGMIALIPTKMANMPSCACAYQAIDMVVDPRFRGRGLFIQMGFAAHQPELPGGELVWGFPNANAAHGWFGRLGWSNLGTVPLLMRPLRSGYLLGRFHPRLAKIDVPLTRHRPLLGFVYTNGDEMASDAGRLWERVRPSYGIAVDRTSNWLRWRLMDKPHSGYRCVGVRSDGDEPLAFVATKLVEKHGAMICYVMEALSAEADGNLLSRLLKSELSNAYASGAEVALAWCSAIAPTYVSFRRAGFLPVPAKARPIEINFGARALNPACSAASVQGAQWYISYLDSDTN